MKDIIETDEDFDEFVKAIYGYFDAEVSDPIKSKTSCDHEYIWYNGIVDNYEYCRRCDEKK